MQNVSAEPCTEDAAGSVIFGRSKISSDAGRLGSRRSDDAVAQSKLFGKFRRINGISGNCSPHLQYTTSVPVSGVLEAAIIPTLIAGVFSLAVAFIGFRSGGKQAVDAAIAKHKFEIDELVQKQLQLKTGFMPGEVRSFAFGGKREDKFVKELRTLGWLECAGQELLISDYGLLYARITETWGSSNKGISFSIPDLRGMFLRGWSNGSASSDLEAGVRRGCKRDCVNAVLESRSIGEPNGNQKRTDRRAAGNQ
jgi:hypothetical protein